MRRFVKKLRGPFPPELLVESNVAAHVDIPCCLTFDMKHYNPRPDSGPATVDRLVQHPVSPLLSTSLTACPVECVSVLHYKTRMDGKAHFYPFMVGQDKAMPRRKGEVGLWQPRFWEHHIRDEPDFANHVRYCWINPVKHGLARHAVDWPYSSIHRDITRGIVEPEWAGAVPVGQFGE